MRTVMTILVAQPKQHAVQIPNWVSDLDSFHTWATSDEFPSSGWYAHLDGNLWIDTEMERLTHNQLKTEFIISIGSLLKTEKPGLLLSDGMLLTHLAAKLSTVPDAMYVSYESLKSGRIEFPRGLDAREAVGSPDMVLEVISPSSRHKDEDILRELYHAAGVREYWLAEGRGSGVTFQILVHGPTGSRRRRK